GIDLPGEAKGIIKKPENISEIDLATISFGQTNTVSPIQFITAFNAIANGGTLIKPHVMKEISHYDDEKDNKVIDKQFDISGDNIKQIIDANKASQLRGYLEKVVSEGGGKKAFIEGYHIGGKTGTAQKAGQGGYQPGKYISSFIGMAPANDPRITVLVSIDEPDPSNYYAGQITAPVAQQVFNDIFNYLAMKSDADSQDIARSMLKDVVIPDVRGMKKADAEKALKDQHLDSESDSNGEYIVDMNPKPGYTVKEGSKIILYTGSAPNYNKVVAVPDVTGLSRDRAVAVFNSVGLKADFEGDGMISEQSIEPGKEVEKGTVITLHTEILGD
ncbi:MAG: PASTA domain-containing protein, partial [Clostridiaceae bacterium]|nr:PASTA domain-containing protein [Clostridiaceae bacterium]